MKLILKAIIGYLIYLIVGLIVMGITTLIVFQMFKDYILM